MGGFFANSFSFCVVNLIANLIFLKYLQNKILASSNKKEKRKKKKETERDKIGKKIRKISKRKILKNTLQMKEKINL